MTWKVEFDDCALKELRKLDPPVQNRIILFLRSVSPPPRDPKRFGKPLTRGQPTLWRYRIGSYRLICRIGQDRLLVLVLAVGHRCEIYR